jgi:hypothetical protein
MCELTVYKVFFSEDINNLDFRPKLTIVSLSRLVYYMIFKVWLRHCLSFIELILYISVSQNISVKEAELKIPQRRLLPLLHRFWHDILVKTLKEIISKSSKGEICKAFRTIFKYQAGTKHVCFWRSIQMFLKEW